MFIYAPVEILVGKPTKGRDIVTDRVVVLPRDIGVAVKLYGSLSEFSGVYPWHLAPKGLAVLRLFNEDCFEDLLGRLENYGITGDTIEEILGREYVNVHAIFSQVPTLVTQCPHEETRSELGQILAMDLEELEKYVEAFL